MQKNMKNAREQVQIISENENPDHDLDLQAYCIAYLRRIYLTCIEIKYKVMKKLNFNSFQSTRKLQFRTYNPEKLKIFSIWSRPVTYTNNFALCFEKWIFHTLATPPHGHNFALHSVWKKFIVQSVKKIIFMFRRSAIEKKNRNICATCKIEIILNFNNMIVWTKWKYFKRML